VALFVAVAVTNPAVAVGRTTSNAALPPGTKMVLRFFFFFFFLRMTLSALVVTACSAISSLPSPKPEASGWGLENNWMVKVVLGVLFRVP
jgi:hypothetical protein